MINKILDASLCSFFATIIIGMMVNRLLPSWEALSADVGGSGVWLVSLFVHFIYGLAIGIGSILSQILYKKGSGSYYFWIITTGVIVVLLHLNLFMPRYEIRFSLFFLLLLVISSLIFLSSSMAWNRLRRHRSFK